MKICHAHRLLLGLRSVLSGIDACLREAEEGKLPPELYLEMREFYAAGLRLQEKILQMDFPVN